jgi:acylphosphatase
MPTRHLLIKGKVQGVFYRATAKEVAERIGITGWVKNTPEGHVEATVSGTEKQVQEFIAWCRQGPQKAVVTGVDVQDVPDEFFTGFSVKRDWF